MVQRNLLRTYIWFNKTYLYIWFNKTHLYIWFNKTYLYIWFNKTYSEHTYIYMVLANPTQKPLCLDVG
jgi:hypothetical protein